MKYFVQMRGMEGAFHVQIEDARDIYILMEEVGAIEKGTARQCYDEGRLVETEKSNAAKIWGEEIDDKQLMLRTLKGEFHKKTAMSVKLPKPKQKVDEYLDAQEANAKPTGVMTREEYDAEIPPEAMEQLREMLGDDEDAIEETLQEQYEMYLEEVAENA